MAITKVGTYTNPPEDIDDYTAIVDHLNAFLKQVGSNAMILTEWINTTTTPAIALGSYISHGGVLFVVDTEDYAITAPVADGTYYLKVEASGDTLLLSWASSITGYAWNAIYNGLYHSDESQILPYQLVVSGTVTVFTKYRITNLMQNGGYNKVDYLGNITASNVTADDITASIITTSTINTDFVNKGIQVRDANKSFYHNTLVAASVWRTELLAIRTELLNSGLLNATDSTIHLKVSGALQSTNDGGSTYYYGIAYECEFYYSNDNITVTIGATSSQSGAVATPLIELNFNSSSAYYFKGALYF